MDNVLTVKIFIAQKMSGLSEDEILRARELTKKKILKYFEENIPLPTVEFIDNYTHDGIDVPKDAGRLWHLGHSIAQLDKADWIYFYHDALDSKGGRIEFEIAKEYGIPVLNKLMNENAYV